MKKTILIMAAIMLVVMIMPTAVFAAGEPGTIYDFSTQAEFDAHSENFERDPEECEIDWDKNMLHMTSIGKDPRVAIRPFDEITCEDYPWMKIGLMNPSDSTVFEMHYKTYDKGIDGKHVVHFPISSKDTERKEYVVNIPETNLATAPEINPEQAEGMTESTWLGDLEYIRLDCLYFDKPSGEVPEGTEFYVEYVALFKTKADADAFDIAAYRNKAAQTPDPVQTTPKNETTATVQPTIPAASTAKAQTATANSSTPAPNAESEIDDNMLIIAIISAVAVVVIGTVIFIIIKKKKK